MTSLAHIIRHPIKAVGYEELERASLREGRALAFDRHWAVAHQGAKFPDMPEAWASKMNFLRGVAAPELMAIRAQFDGVTLTLTHPRADAISLNPAQDEAKLLAWLAPLWPAKHPAPRGLVQVKDQALADCPEPYLSIIGLASNAALGAHLGQTLSIHRWRANLWLDGLSPFEELAWVGKRIKIGAAILEVRETITRCAATTINPDTALRDAETLDALKATRGHQLFGVYATVLASGDIARADRVEIL